MYRQGASASRESGKGQGMTGATGKPDKPRRVVLTGATGLLGRYLLRDLLLAGHRVTTLVRDTRSESAAQRIAAVVAFWEGSLGRKLPPVTVAAGDLTLPPFGLSAGEEQRLPTSC